MMDQRLLDELCAELRRYPTMAQAFSSGADLSVVRGGSSVPDGAEIFRIGESYILHLSPQAFPNVAFEEAAAMRQAKEKIGSHLSCPILNVVATGQIRGRSYLALPLVRSFSRNRFLCAMQRRWAARDVLAWLRGLASISLGGDGDGDEVDVSVFLHNLDFLRHTLNGCTSFNRDMDTAIALLKNNEVKPMHVPMHSDLWIGNIMRKKDGRLVIIDWRGFQPRGYPLFDLVRFAESVGMTKGKIKAETLAHLSILKQPPHAAPVLLLSGLGHIARNLGEFPVKKFKVMFENSMQQLTGALK